MGDTKRVDGDEDRIARVLTWNLERRSSTSPRAAAAIDYLMSQAPDIVVLTEARTTLPLPDGHVLWSYSPIGTRFAADERKVVMWSREPWRDVDRIGVPGLDATRFVAATTSTPIGVVRVLGICIPYHMAGVTTGPEPRRRPWELHLAYLEVLGSFVGATAAPTVVAGDFNQKIPRMSGGHRAAADALTAAFAPTTIATTGAPAGGTRPGIDHIAVSSHLRAAKVWAWPQAVDGVRISDHEGAGADLVAHANDGETMPTIRSLRHPTDRACIACSTSPSLLVTGGGPDCRRLRPLTEARPGDSATVAADRPSASVNDTMIPNLERKQLILNSCRNLLRPTQESQ